MSEVVVYAGSYGGWVQSMAAADFVGACRGTGSLLVDASALDVGISYFVTGSYWYCWEGLEEFDTGTALPDDTTVTAAVFSFYVKVDSSLQNEWTLEVRGPYNFGTTLETGDFVSSTNLGSYDLLASMPTTAISGVGTFYTLTSETAFLDAISLTGLTSVILDSDKHRLEQQPSVTPTWKNDVLDGNKSYDYITIQYGPVAPPTIDASQVDDDIQVAWT